MNKTLFTTALLLAACVANSNAQEQDYMTYLSCDFTDGIPAEFTTHDLDQQTLHYSMIQGGIKQGEAWARKKESGTGNYYAVSACRYKEIEGVELKPSDDWLITPQIWVRGNEATLSWDSKAFKNMLKEGAGYRVLISTTGNNPADFTQPAILSVEEESLTEWVNHTIDLSDYAGQHIYIAFHNNSAQGEFIGIDNLSVTGTRGICEFKPITGTHHCGSNSFNVTVSVTSYCNDPITDMTLYYRYNDELFSKTLTDLNIAKYEVYQYSFDSSIYVAYGDTVHYTIGAIVNGVQQDEIECSTVGFAFQPAQRVVVEEGTGMWCSFCPVGLLAMDILSERYPEQFIGVAIHNQDILAVDKYFQKIGFSGLPEAIVNRKHKLQSTNIMNKINIDGVSKYVVEGGGMETYFLEELNSVTPIEVLLSNIIYDNNQVNFDATVHAAMDIHDLQYCLEFAVIENHLSGDGYYQKNGYADGDIELYGWEKKSQNVFDFEFNHIARAIYDDYQGIENSVPTQLIVGEEYTSTYTFELPQTIQTPGNVKILAMIIDMTDGSIVNATESDLVAAINTVNASQQTVCFSANGRINITMPTAAQAHIALYNIAGSQVASHTSHNASVQLPAPAPGAYIVTITQDNNTSTHKIVVR